MNFLIEVALGATIASHYLFPGYDVRPVAVIIGVVWATNLIVNLSKKKGSECL